MDHADAPDPVPTRLREGLERIALVLRADLWVAAGTSGLNPTQAQVLALLAGRPAGLRPTEIAVHLAVSPPSVADTLSALERKGLVRPTPDPADARAVIARLTEEGRDVGGTIAGAASHVTSALAQLPPADQATLLMTQIRLIRALQLAGAVPVQRMCVSCRHFRPYAHSDAARPHHCTFVDAAFGQQDLRIDCRDHETADPSARAATWMEFEKDRSPNPPGD